MRENDGRKLDHKTLEALRLRAVERVNSGAHPEDVAGALSLHRKTVYGWLAKYRDGGRGALRARPGRPPRLSALQMRALWGLIVGGDPRQMQFDFALWTRAMVRELIRREFGVGLSDVSVGRLLAKMGMSPQRPLYRVGLDYSIWPDQTSGLGSSLSDLLGGLPGRIPSARLHDGASPA